MKKVRFETPTRSAMTRMEDHECHSPRPFMQRISAPSYVPMLNPYEKLLPYFDDPVERYETSDSSPYPTANKTELPIAEAPGWSPSNDLDLSLLDASSQEPRQHIYRPIEIPRNNVLFSQDLSVTPVTTTRNEHAPVLTYLQNKELHVPYSNSLSTHSSSTQNKNVNIQNYTPPHAPRKDSSFFIRRDNLDMYYKSSDPLSSGLGNMKLGKENNPAQMKTEMMRPGNGMSPIAQQKITSPQVNLDDSLCKSHHCVRSPENTCRMPSKVRNSCTRIQNYNTQQYAYDIQAINCQHCTPVPVVNQCKCGHQETPSPENKNAVDKKTWAIQKFEKAQNKTPESFEISKQTSVTKEKREPTVADLFKIIKLQNEQLQLLQEKVDKFISSNNTNVLTTHNVQTMSDKNYVTEHVALQTVDQEQHKISIGVMTSFEMVHTSTVINKEILTQTSENAQIQCNRSQISIKGVTSKPANFNFLEGISNSPDIQTTDGIHVQRQIDNVNDDKTLNEMSLYNVQVDNATTPMISPEQTMYLDVRDYSDSDSSTDDSPVGWTYYNKVMTHVNGMMQESEMPSSASAMYRNTRHKFLQMQVDKTNVSVTKRVKFGEDIGIAPANVHTSDTSLKMNQLAAKYLNMPPPAPNRAPARRQSAPIDMSIATRHYMERHKLLQGNPRSGSPTRVAQPCDMPRFLDITALKQQTKLL